MGWMWMRPVDSIEEKKKRFTYPYSKLVGLLFNDSILLRSYSYVPHLVSKRTMPSQTI